MFMIKFINKRAGHSRKIIVVCKKGAGMKNGRVLEVLGYVDSAEFIVNIFRLNFWLAKTHVIIRPGVAKLFELLSPKV